mmetsp:Transcript_23230/g.49447  ORF Transcript_23230/g.49447 Transcript_23230/m.49447 type:complete len:294 (-) Transcript_23230:597-1478(-)
MAEERDPQAHGQAWASGAQGRHRRRRAGQRPVGRGDEARDYRPGHDPRARGAVPGRAHVRPGQRHGERDHEARQGHRGRRQDRRHVDSLANRVLLWVVRQPLPARVWPSGLLRESRRGRGVLGHGRGGEGPELYHERVARRAPRSTLELGQNHGRVREVWPGAGERRKGEAAPEHGVPRVGRRGGGRQEEAARGRDEEVLLPGSESSGEVQDAEELHRRGLPGLQDRGQDLVHAGDRVLVLGEGEARRRCELRELHASPPLGPLHGGRPASVRRRGLHAFPHDGAPDLCQGEG